MSKSKKINIGITINVDDYQGINLFINGIRQNVILLREAFEKCKNVNNSYIINTSTSKTSIEGSVWEKYKDFIITKTEAVQKCDTIVVSQGALHLSEYEQYKKLGKKIIKQVLGAEFSILNERCLFDLPAGNVYHRNSFVDSVWISPHFYKRDRHFFQAIYDNADIKQAPYIWDPRFIEEHVRILKTDRENFCETYLPNKNKKKRISTMEANLNIVKTCLFPIVIAELVERKYPDLIEKFRVFGGAAISKKQDMIDFVINMDINKNKKSFFEKRYPTVWTLFAHTDIVLSHQNQCELNYLYLDAAWLGYPVVHNSPMMKELGWYYPENDAEEAISHIKYLVDNFDAVEYPNEKYLKKSREYASTYLLTNPKNIKAYEKLIEGVLERIS